MLNLMRQLDHERGACFIQTVHSVLRQVTLNEAVSGRRLTLKAWLTAESSMGQSILPFTLTVPTKKSCCLTSCWHKANNKQATRGFLIMFYCSEGGQMTNSILTSLKTCKSATQTTTLTRWSSLCVDRLRESAECTSAEGVKKEDRNRKT